MIIYIEDRTIPAHIYPEFYKEFGDNMDDFSESAQ